MNNLSFFGRLDSEPQLRGMPGRDVCEFWLEVNGRFDKHPMYVTIVSFKGLAVRLAEELSEGDEVAVTGHLRSQRWPARSKERRLYLHEVVARDVQRATSTRTGSSGE